jgi:hypothetical protein
MFLAFGVAALLVALGLFWLLLRLRRTLTILEETLEITNEEMRESLPEVRDTIGNVSDITGMVNVALKAGSRGAERAGQEAAATAFGVRTAGRSLWRSLFVKRGGTGGGS